MSLIVRPFAAAAVLLALTALPVSAQDSAFGIGARLAMVRFDTNADVDAVRFFGGQIRARMSARTAFELSMDIRREDHELLNQRVRDLPVQASLLFFLARGSFSPFLLGGGGWYFKKVEALEGDNVVLSATSHDFGWHAGIGAELRLGRHAGIHGDYRYTFLHFGEDETGDRNNILGRSYLPGYNGSMWTAGFTVYF